MGIKADQDDLWRELFDGELIPGTVEWIDRERCWKVEIFCPRNEWDGPTPRRWAGHPIKYIWGSDGDEGP